MTTKDHTAVDGLFVETWGRGTPVVLVHGSLATGVDTGATQPGGQVEGGAKPNPQTEEGRSFQADQGGKTGQSGGSSERIDTDGDGRTRDPNDTSPTDNGGRDAPAQR